MFNSLALKLLVIAILCLKLKSLTHALTVTFTKIECVEYDKTFLYFDSCYLKVLGRNKIGANIYVRLLQTPVDNITVNAGFYVKSSSQNYNPFLYNSTVNFCSFVKRASRFKFWKIMFEICKEFSNVNHTCPYNHDLIVKSFVLNPGMFRYIPFPSGDYLVKVQAGVNQVYKGQIFLYLNMKE